MDCQLISNGTILCTESYGYGFWIQTGAIILSAIAAVGLVYYTLDVSRKRATVDLLIHQLRDEKLRESEKIFYDMQRKGDSLTPFACNKDCVEHRAILDVLNNHEFNASGIRDKVFHEASYKRMVRGVVIKDWNSLKPFVTEIRSSRKHSTLFCEFEWLAEKWIAEK